MADTARSIRRDEVLALLRAHKAELDAFGLKSLALIGSVARDEAGPDSDIDFLVEFEGEATWDRYTDVKFFLEDQFERRIDLVMTGALKPRMRPSVEQDAIHVA